ARARLRPVRSEARGDPRRVVPAVADDLLGRAVEGAEGIREVRDGEAARQEANPVLADLPALLVDAERREVAVVRGVARDLVARGLQGVQLRGGHVADLVDARVVDEEGRAHPA